MTTQNDLGSDTVFSRLRAAHLAGDVALQIELFNAFPVHCWYGGSQTELYSILKALPAEAEHQSLFIKYVTTFFTGLPPEWEPAAYATLYGAPAQRPPLSWEVVMRSIGLRLSGYSREAAELLPERDLTPAPYVFSPTESVRHALMRVQRGITLMHMARFQEARLELAGAHATHLPAELMVLQREGLMKSALIEAMYGDQREARGLLEVAARVPRTQSWLETQLDAEAVLVTALISEAPDRAAALRKLLTIPLQVFGEMWPFAVLGQQRIFDQLGRRAEFAKRIELLSEAAMTSVPGNGVPGSALCIAQAMVSIVGGDVNKAREQVALADQSVLLTRRVQAMLHMRAGASETALTCALEMRPAVQSLRQFEIWRTSLEVTALLSLGEEADAKLVLEVLLSEMNGLNEEERRIFTPELHRFAERCGIAWPDLPENPEPSSIAPAVSVVVLSERERQVLSEIALGRSRAETAQRLFLSENTVKTHLSSLYKKFGVTNRAQVIAEARRRSMV